VKIKERHWQGKDLPFPVLLDGTGKTGKLFGIVAHPTGLLIDPQGKLVGPARAEDLEKKLPALSASKRWARHRDVRGNTLWSFEPDGNSLKKMAALLGKWVGCQVELDADAVKASGLTADGPLPGVVVGGPVTLRSLDELLLAPHGLGVAASRDEKKLLITKRPAKAEAKSYLQTSRAKELEARLDGKKAEEDEAKPLTFDGEPLLEALRRLSQEYDVPVALDARAMRDKKLDPKAKVSGKVVPEKLRESLAKLLGPAGLKVEVAHEVLLVSPAKK